MRARERAIAVKLVGAQAGVRHDPVKHEECARVAQQQRAAALRRSLDH